MWNWWYNHGASKRSSTQLAICKNTNQDRRCRSLDRSVLDTSLLEALCPYLCVRLGTVGQKSPSNLFVARYCSPMSGSGDGCLSLSRELVGNHCSGKYLGVLDQRMSAGSSTAGSL